MTPRQREKIEAVGKHGSRRKAAKALNVNHSAIDKAIAVGRKSDPAWVEAALKHGFNASHAGWWKTAPADGEPGVSVYIGRAQADATDALRQSMEAAVAAFTDRVLPVEPLPAPTRRGHPGVLDLLPLADLHIGMYAWDREGGAAWNLSEAERLIVGAARKLMTRDNRGRSLLMPFLGDWRHYERRDPVTNISGHIVSTDTRVAKVQATAIRIKVALIDMALTCYDHVTVIDVEGNHDEVSVHADREWTKIAYRNEPRLSVVDDDALPYYAYRHGKVFIGFHHGHIKGIKKPMDRASLAMRFCTSRPDDWTKATALRAVFSGHFHHAIAGWDNAFGVWFEQIETIAAADAHGARNFDKARRGITAIQFEADHGEIGRDTVPPSLVD